MAADELPATDTSREAPRFNPYKWLEIEYQKAAERYENIYKSYWQSFAYLSEISGAILTFGGSHIGDLFFTIFLASLPLLLWYYASCVPLDKYGVQVETRLVEIEKIVTGLVAKEQGISVQDSSSSWPAMFTEFKKGREGQPKQPAIRIIGEMIGALFQFERSEHPRVRKTMDAAFFLVRVVAALCLAIWILQKFFPPAPPAQALPPTVTIEVGKNLGDVLKDALQRLPHSTPSPPTGKTSP